MVNNYKTKLVIFDMILTKYYIKIINHSITNLPLLLLYFTFSFKTTLSFNQSPLIDYNYAYNTPSFIYQSFALCFHEPFGKKSYL